MKDGKMTANESMVFEAVKAAGRIEIGELAGKLGKTTRGIGPNINALAKENLVVREKVQEEGAEKPTTYVVITDAGLSFTPAE